MVITIIGRSRNHLASPIELRARITGNDLQHDVISNSNGAKNGAVQIIGPYIPNALTDKQVNEKTGTDTDVCYIRPGLSEAG